MGGFFTKNPECNLETPDECISGFRCRTLRCHMGSVEDVKFDHSGRFLASGCGDGIINIYNTDDGRLLRSLKLRRPFIDSISWHPHKPILAANHDGDSELALWDVTTGKCITSFKVRGTYDMSFCDSGVLMCIGDGCKYITVLENVEFAHTVKHSKIELDKMIFVLSFGPKGILALRGFGGKLTLFDTTSKSVVSVLEGHEGAILGVSFHPVKQLIASASRDNSIRIWDTQTCKCIRKTSLDIRNIGNHSRLSFNSSGNLLAFSDCSELLIWGTASFELFYRLYLEEISCFSFHPLKAYTLAFGGGKNHHVKIMNLVNQNTVRAFTLVILCRNFRSESHFHFGKMPKEILREILVSVDRKFFYLYPDFLKK